MEEPTTIGDLLRSVEQLAGRVMEAITKAIDHVVARILNTPVDDVLVVVGTLVIVIGLLVLGSVGCEWVRKLWQPRNREEPAVVNKKQHDLSGGNPN